MGTIQHPERKLSILLVGYVPDGSTLTDAEVQAAVLRELSLSLQLSSWIRFTACLPGMHVVPIPGDPKSGPPGAGIVRPA